MCRFANTASTCAFSGSTLLICALRAGAEPPFPDTAATSAIIAPTTSKTSATSRMIFIQLHGRSPDTVPVRPLMRIWNSFSW